MMVLRLLDTPWTGRLCRLTFWGVLASILWMALTPHPPELAIDAWGDKAQHGLAFVALTLLAGIAYPRWPLALIVALMVAVGLGIEVAQGTMGLGRAADYQDLGADLVAILLGAGFLFCLRRILGAKASLPPIATEGLVPSPAERDRM